VADGETHAAAEIIAGADAHSTSPNGFGAEAAPHALPSPAVLAGAAILGGFLLARLVRRFRG
jgi:predicted nucleic acid-binding Zn ribbon protein